MRYYLKGVRQTCDDMGGLEFFESTSTEQRGKMWSAIFDQNKVRVATASLGQIHSREYNHGNLLYMFEWFWILILMLVFGISGLIVYVLRFSGLGIRYLAGFWLEIMRYIGFMLLFC